MTAAQQQQQLLHELLREDQEPFHLTEYIADRRSQFKESSKDLPVKPCAQGVRRNASFCRNACFQTSAESPSIDPPPSRDPNGGILLRVPSSTAALLHEAAARIQKRSDRNAGVLGSILKKLRNHRRRNRKQIEEPSRASTSGKDTAGDFLDGGQRYCISPFTFSFIKSPSFSIGATPEFQSPAASPAHQEENCKYKAETEEDEKDQSSPVSILEPPFHDDDDCRLPEEDEEGEQEEEPIENISYENLEKAKQKLLYRIRRFEKLAALHPVELDQVFLSRQKRKSAIGKTDFAEVEMMVGLELNKGGGGGEAEEEVEEITREIEVGITGLLLEELFTNSI
ncbi:hypothetical protein M569_09782 [Genlisea aurea]|uniref:DUF4378 domain-containing protein n=1 Tax=Genlisea aurea TaxID=192259 RepID=S8DPK6_9LAMI|nr:hypothetical protein M569_09782 [Genlisea aurea]